MKKQQSGFKLKDEANVLSKQINSEEAYILGFLKGFDRNTMKEWMDKGYWDLEIEYYYKSY